MGLSASQSFAQKAKPIDFAHDIFPILKARCSSCHTAGTYKGKLSLDTREDILKAKIVVVGKSGESELIDRVTTDLKARRMPPKGKPLDSKQVALLKRWIDEGLAWQEGFSFKKRNYIAKLEPRRPKLPPVQAGRTNPIDRIVDAYFAKHKVARPAAIDDATFLRRVHLDLVGLLPSKEQLETFLQDESPDKRKVAVQRLLADKRGYAEHWLTFWNDHLRNDYRGTGYIDGGRKPITDWLFRALLENKPYDQFVRELIAPTPESEGFIRGIKWRGNVNASQVRELQFSQNISQVFLGINMKCASCHDSFIDHWKLDDAYGLAAIVSERKLEIHRCDKPTGEYPTPKFVFPQLGTIDAKLPPKQRLQRLAELMTSPQNGRFSRTIVNRLWQRLMGRGIVHPVDVMENEPWSEDLLDYLGSEFAETGYDLKKMLELIATSEIYQSQCLDEREEGDFVFHGPTVRRMSAEQFLDAIWRLTKSAPGKPDANFGDRKGEPVRASLVASSSLMRALGRPNREQVVTTRPAELTTLQALDLSNGEELTRLMTMGSQSLRKEHPDWSAERMVESVFLRTLARKPRPEEAKIAVEIVGSPMTDTGLSDLLWSVFMLPEFQMIR